MADPHDADVAVELALLRAARSDILGCLSRIDHLATPERSSWLADVNASLERKILRLAFASGASQRSDVREA